MRENPVSVCPLGAWVAFGLHVVPRHSASRADFDASPYRRSMQFTSLCVLDELGPMASEWEDTIRLASSTSRSALADRVEKMQEIRRKVRSLSVPSCASVVQQRYVQAMDATIEAFMTFLAEGSQMKVDLQARVAGKLMADASELISDLSRGGALPNDVVQLQTLEYLVDSVPGTELRIDYRAEDGERTTFSATAPLREQFQAPEGFHILIEAWVGRDQPIACGISVDGKLIATNKGTEVTICMNYFPTE